MRQRHGCVSVCVRRCAERRMGVAARSAHTHGIAHVVRGVLHDAPGAAARRCKCAGPRGMRSAVEEAAACSIRARRARQVSRHVARHIAPRPLAVLRVRALPDDHKEPVRRRQTRHRRAARRRRTRISRHTQAVRLAARIMQRLRSPPPHLAPTFPPPDFAQRKATAVVMNPVFF